jgi:tetratricopeptide (TPR) repeat protein
VRLFGERRFADAARAFEAALVEAALAEAPSESMIRANLAFALAHQAVEEARSGEKYRVKEAVALLDRALELKPGTLDFQKAKGEILYGLGDLRGARAAFEDVAQHEDDPLAERYLGEIAYREERLSEALRRWKRALQLGDPDPGLPERIAKVEREAGVESDMEISRGRHFSVKFADGEAGAESQAEMVLRSLEAIRDRVEREYDVVPSGTISVILYSQEEFRGVTGAHAWAGAIFDGKIRVPLRGFAGAGDQAERLLAHEYAHAVVRELAEGRAPAWLDEGIAQKIAGEWSGFREGAAAARLRDEGPIPFDSLETSFVHIAERGAAERAYYQSYLAVDYLTRRYYTRDLRAILGKLAGGQTIEEALREVCRLTYEGLSRSLADEVAARASAP